MELPSGKSKIKNSKTVYKSLESSDITVESIIDDIKNIIENNEDPSTKINDLVNGVEDKIEKNNVIDRDEIKKMILKHPFFKHPNHYYIRLITIMKYLKKKGIDVRIKDIDLVVDEIIQTIPGVTKIKEDRYSLKK